MKNILFLLFSIATFGQVSTGNETPFDYGIQNTAAQLVGNSDYVVTQGNDGTYGKYLFNLNNIEKKQFLSTGLVKNGTVSINADPTKYNISAGIGVITNYDNPEIPTCTVVNFPAVTGKTPTYLTTGLITYVAINSSGVIVEQATQFTTSQRRDLIILGAVIHSNLTTINVVNNISAPTNADTNQLHDLMTYIGALNLTGNKYTANGANLSLDKSAGSIFKPGVNFATDWKKPHELEQSLQTLLTFRYRLSNGTEYADATVLNPAIYESGGTLISVPSNKFTIQTVTMFQTGLTRIQPGQNIYNSLAEAENAILTRSFVVETNIAANGITRAYVILRNSTTSLQNTSDAKIVETTKFGGVASGGVSLSDAAIIAALGYTPANLTDVNTTNSNGNTIWVASNDATAEQKNNALYVCDGTADEVQINQAIQAISASRGGTVRLTQGRFSLSTPIIIDRALSLVGSGRGIKLSLDNPATATDTRGTAIYQTTNTDVIKIDTPNKLQGFEIKDMLLIGYGRQNTPTGHGIHIAGGSDVSVIRNVSISDCYAGIFYNHDVTAQMLDTPWIDQCSIQRNHVGMLIIGGHLMRITNNIFWENYGIGSYGGYDFNCGGIAIQGLGNNLISNNHFGENDFIEGANVSKNSSHLSLIYANDLVTNNFFGGIQGNGIKMTGYVSYSKVSNNYFTNFGKGTGLTNAQRSGIYIEFSQSNVIEDNYMLSATGSYGIYEDYTSFKNSFVNNVFQDLINNTANRIFSEGTENYQNGTIVRPDLLPEKYVPVNGDIDINDNKTFTAETYFNENIGVGTGAGIISTGISDMTGNIQGQSIILRQDNLLDGTLIRPVPSGGAGDYDFHTFKNSILDGNLFLQRLLGSVGIGNGSNANSTGKKLDVWGNTAIGGGARYDVNATLEISASGNNSVVYSRPASSNQNGFFFNTAGNFDWFVGNFGFENDLKFFDVVNGTTRLNVVHGSVSGGITIDGSTGTISLTGTPTAPTATVGTNTTQIATTAFVQGIKPYKVYTALLTQTGTSAPTATVLENTFGGTVTWTRVGTGAYLATLTGAFTTNKTAVFTTLNTPSATLNGAVFRGNWTSANDCLFQTETTSGQFDGAMANASVEIRVYN